MSTSITLVSHHLCPYVQRAAIVLTEKQVPFERIYVDLSNKPDWFKALSPLGKVPVLKVDSGGTQAALFESAVILEYLEETQGDPLHPGDPLERAAHRGWIAFGSTILNDIGSLYSVPQATMFNELITLLRDRFQRLETVLGAGPYFDGERFSLVDAVFGPVFRYFDVFDQIHPLGIFTRTPKVAAWRAALAERPSVRTAVPEHYETLLQEFLKGRGSYLSLLMR